MPALPALPFRPSTTTRYRASGNGAARLRGWLLATLLAPMMLSAEPLALELKIKAAYLYHFTRFVEWPSAGESEEEPPLRICLLGESGLAPHLAPLQERHDDDRPLTVVRLGENEDPSGCQLLYIALDHRKSLPRVLAALRSRPVLTVSDIPDFASRGGMIGFLRHDGRVRLEMNLATLRRAGLQVNAQLIEVCLRVYDEEQAL